MKLYDFDGMFDLKLSEYIKKNRDKYSESEWEDIIPKLYNSFGDTFIKSVGDTPKGFYSKLTDSGLISALSTHLKKGMPVPRFLTDEIESRNIEKLLMPLLDGSDAEKEFAVNLIGSDDGAIKKYLNMLVSSDCGEELKGCLLDCIKEKADLVIDEVIKLYEKGIEPRLMLEIMSRSVIRTDKIFDILIKEFRGSGEDLPFYANLLSVYGDERAIDHLKTAIEAEGISYLEYRELHHSIESLGGTYETERDFSSDPYYELIQSHNPAPQDIFGTVNKKD